MAMWQSIPSSSSVLWGDHFQAIEDGSWGPGMSQGWCIVTELVLQPAGKKAVPNTNCQRPLFSCLDLWEIIWPLHTPRASKTRVVAVMSDVFQEATRFICKPLNPERASTRYWVEAFRVSKFYPKCCCDHLQQVGLFTPGRGEAQWGVSMTAQSPSRSLHILLWLVGLMLFSFSSGIWDVLPFQASCLLGSPAVLWGLIIEPRTFPSLYQAVFLDISLP